MLETTRMRLSASSLCLSFVPAGPGRGQWTVDPANGHGYRLIAGSHRSASDSTACARADGWDDEAETAGYCGRLVTIDDAAANSWLASTCGGTEHDWIGLTDGDVEGSFRCISGESATFSRWDSGGPDDAHAGGKATLHANHCLGKPGCWNDLLEGVDSRAHAVRLCKPNRRQPTPRTRMVTRLLDQQPARRVSRS